VLVSLNFIPRFSGDLHGHIENQDFEE